MKPIKMLVVGAGNRGTTYAGYALEHPEEATVVAIVEPRAFHRERLARLHGIPTERVYSNWPEAVALERFADVVIIATQDALHADVAVAFASRGYHILLEKPMATTEGDCRRIVEAVERHGVLMAVCLVYRYVKYTQRLKEIIASGAIGDVVCIQHFEPVGYWHQAHSFVRGNWRNEAESSFMLMTKSCHDIDWLHFMVEDACIAVSSFGSLRHFRKEEQPCGASDRCFTCAVESACPYSAKRFYFGLLNEGKTDWPLDVVVAEVSEAALRHALKTGPYGRCVYACDNDVVDNQVVNLQYASGQTASFVMTAFNNVGGRHTRIFGTHGELYLNGGERTLVDGRWHPGHPVIRHFDFLTERLTHEHIVDEENTALTGHHNGDYRMMRQVVRALRERRPELILANARSTLASHLTVFAAERSRRTTQTVTLN